MTKGPFRIAHVLFGRPGPDTLEGLGKSVFHLARSQSAQGVDVAVFCLTQSPPGAIDGVAVRSFPPSAIPFKVPMDLREAVRDWSPDVLHLHSCYLPVNVSLAGFATRSGLPYVVSPHGAITPGSLGVRGWLKLPYKYLFERPLLNKAAFVHSLGTHEELSRYGVRSPIVTIPNGVELPSDGQDGVNNPGPREISQTRRFLFLGRIDPYVKGLDLLVAAVARVAPRDFVVVIAGPSHRNGRESLERTIRRLGVAQRVRVQGACQGPRKQALLNRADVFVHTSRYEGMPHAVLEACSRGLPCLVTAPADPMGKLSRVGGAVVVKCDPLSIASGMIEFCERTPQRLKAMGTRGKRLMAEEFQWAPIASEMIGAYRRFGFPRNVRRDTR